MVTWFACWNIEINENKTQTIYFSHRLRPPGAHHTLNGRNIPFVSYVKYLVVTWRLHIEMIKAKAFRIFIRIYSVFKSERFRTNITLAPPAN
jgi:hypothetical protein